MNQHLTTTPTVVSGANTTSNIELLKKQIELLQQKVLELLKQLAAIKQR
jgi:hypothetical protein